MDRVRDMASEKAVVIFGKSSCCICHSIKRLLYEVGVSPAVYELDEVPNGREIEWALQGLGCNPSVPAVFIGGRFVGSAKDVLTLHVEGSLKQMLDAALVQVVATSRLEGCNNIESKCCILRKLAVT